MREITLHEITPGKNWPAGKRPDWVDERTRLYTGFIVTVAAREWESIVTAFDGVRTTAYLTAYGFDLEHHGPAVESMAGASACHRKCVKKWFEDSYAVNVSFD
jgi:hypothetical protein